MELQNFEVEIDEEGIDFQEPLKTNRMNYSLSQVVNHLKSHSRYPIEYEKYDPELLEMINDANNDYLTAFHRDQFLNFHPIEGKLVMKELFRNMDRTIDQGRNKGYDIK